MNSNWSYSPETVKLGVDLCGLDLWPLTLTFCMEVTFVIVNDSWKFHDDTMMGTWWKGCDRRTDRRTDRQTDWTSHIAAWSQLKTHKIARNWNFIKYKSIQISTNALTQFWCWSWRNGLDYSYIPFFVVYGKSHQGITQSCTSPSQPPQPCCPRGWAGGSAGWDYVTVFAELSSCC